MNRREKITAAQCVSSVAGLRRDARIAGVLLYSGDTADALRGCDFRIAKLTARSTR